MPRNKHLKGRDEGDSPVSAASRELAWLAVICLLLMVIPLVPVVLLYLLFKELNFFEVGDWSRGVFASGPIAVYVALLHYGFSHIFTFLVGFMKFGTSYVPRGFVGEWDCSSQTRSSGKSSQGDVIASIGASGVAFAGILNGEDNDCARFAHIEAQHCLLEIEKKTAKILYQIRATRHDGTPVLYDCIFSGVIIPKHAGAPLQIPLCQNE